MTAQRKGLRRKWSSGNALTADACVAQPVAQLRIETRQERLPRESQSEGKI